MARPGPALFELIRGSGAPPGLPARSEPSGGPPPLVRITPKAGVVEPKPQAGPSPESDRAWVAWTKKGSWFDPSRTVTVPMTAVLFVIGGAIVVLVITWAVAYSIGSSRGQELVKRDLGPTVQPENIPLNQNLIANPAKAPDPKPPAFVGDKKPAPVTPAPSGGPVATGSEPRVAGINYYLLASGLEKEAAERMVAFLSKNGLPSAMAVDKPAGGSNNRGSYVVFATKGLTSEEYKLGERFPARAEVVNQASRLGKLWKDQKGQTDFSQAYWQKFKG